MAGHEITDYISAGLKAVGLQSQVIGRNVSNLNTRGFRRGDVQFDELLAKALEGAGGEELESHIFQPKLLPLNERGNDVSLEGEMGEMVKNGVKARVYLRTLAKIYTQMEMAIRDRM